MRLIKLMIYAQQTEPVSPLLFSRPDETTARGTKFMKRRDITPPLAFLPSELIQFCTSAVALRPKITCSDLPSLR